MQVPRSAALFELLAGLFGWTWIIASLAFLCFLVSAIFWEGSWWNVLYAFLTGGVAKWLARGFEDNKRRVLFEAQMVAEGMSSAEASEAWAKAYMGREPPST